MFKNKIKLIALDGYGILLSRGYPQTVAVIAKKTGLPEKWLFDVIYKKYFNQAALKKITQKQAWESAVKELKLPMSWQALRALHLGLFKINQPAFRLAKELKKKYKVIMLSKNTRSQFADTKKKLPAVWRELEAINTWEYNLPKASKETINFLCQRYRVKPQEILLADDQAVNLAAAKKMGVKTIFYKNFKQFKKELEKYA
ncbi:MAG: hypothetical protein A3J65_04045 [Candidatus Buchananbacteria bacterium RIFCSPHIGHO2_02_FULL_45_11b]|uniref:Uncharacterized protein n=4 Tax=Candidatus Buchananiibacteriota TaxID=1817903 RepID=A0A1G1YQV1_9BACT|nr:MAG: hypothetical protein A2663_00450 [Candidatus Buchananbacteria bacterium RIFCSPHIGHO2_01_FULL_46_12]OGY51056.1 MAG: hypothetical protein A3J65_04045 [Candidatus Buchananbacteria bacterium RIFCSPHIGHO2_02_FULL_45_11b]OGY54186.1 MAG: hypothetical protein A3B15_01110 [Candidatus Buchananbacteria bacterium RIFCSPLOWO2_01_FULL_45_31]OGY57243.1 MAG: hypothetical protein A3H67_00205 [Candidatus Buchananbacteria bacterium RIFCSPLOWO2_02_FULL_46_11b]